MSTRDNRLRGALNLPLPATRANQIGRRDLEDLYRITLPTGRSRLNLRVAQLGRNRGNIAVELYQVKGDIGQVLRRVGNRDFGRIRSGDRNLSFQFITSQVGRSANRTLTRELEGGNYVVRLARRSGESRYRLNITSEALPPTPTPPNPGPNPTPTPGLETLPGNSIATAFSASAPTTAPLQGNVNDADKQDFYRVTVGSTGDYKIQLSGLTSNANIEILGADGTTVLKNGLRPGAASETLIQPLDAGTYFFRVFQAGAGSNTGYAIDVAPMPADKFGNTDLDATPVTLGSQREIFTNYVVDGGKASPKDVFKFTINPGEEKKDFQAVLTGLTDGNLDGDLELRFYKAIPDPNNPGQFLPATAQPLDRRAGTDIEAFRGTLGEGTYFLEVGAGGPGEGSEYKLGLTLLDARDQPTVTRDINVGEGNSDPDGVNIVTINGSTYLSANDGRGEALWVSNGTLDTTRKIRNFNQVERIVRAGNLLFFRADDGAGAGLELWSSDGTEAGTRLVADIAAGSRGSTPENLTTVGDRVYFTAEGSTGRKLYRTTGAQSVEEVTIPGSVLTEVGQLKAVTDSTNPAVTHLFFVGASTGAIDSRGSELWRIQNAAGASPGTPTLIDVDGNTETASQPSSLIQIGNYLYMKAQYKDRNALRGDDNIYRIDINNIQAKRHMIDVVSGNDYNVQNLTAVGNTLYFTDIGSGETPRSLYKIQNANLETGTTVAEVKALILPTNLIAVDNQLFFIAQRSNDSESEDRKLWRYDGTNEPTVFTTGVDLPLSGSELVAVRRDTGVRLYTVGYRAPGIFSGGIDLFEIDPTNISSPTVKRIDVNPFGSAEVSSLINPGANTPETTDDVLYFIATEPSTGRELWTF